MFFTKGYSPKVTDFLNGGKFSLKALLDIMEDCGSRHAKSVGDDMIKNGLSGLNWIIAEWNIEIISLPEYGEDLSVTTRIRGKTPSAAIYREFCVKDENGEIMALAEAKVAMFDFENSKIVRITDDILSPYKPEEKTGFELLGRLKEPSGYESETVLAVCKCDIDYNNHLHNTCYLNYALESLTPEEYRYIDFKNIRIAYKSPVMTGAKLTIKKHSDKGVITVGMYDNEKLCSIVELK